MYILEIDRLKQCLRSELLLNLDINTYKFVSILELTMDTEISETCIQNSNVAFLKCLISVLLLRNFGMSIIYSE